MPLSPRDKRALTILGGVAVVAVLFLFLFVLRGGGGPEEAALPTPTGTVSPPPTVSPTETPRTTSPPVNLASDRDPFSIPPGLASPSPTGGEVSPSGTVTTPPTTATTPPSTSTTPPPTSPPPTSPPPTSPPPTSPPPVVTDTIEIGGHTVTLEHVNADKGRVQVKVDGQQWEVEEGGLFAETFKLVKILDNGCARFLYGDQSFELCPKGTDPTNAS